MTIAAFFFAAKATFPSLLPEKKTKVIEIGTNRKLTSYVGERDHFRGTQIFGGKGIECHTFPELCYFPRDTDTFATWRLQKIPNLGIFFHAVKNANAPRPNLVTRNMRWQGERAHKVASYSHYHTRGAWRKKMRTKSAKLEPFFSLLLAYADVTASFSLSVCRWRWDLLQKPP